MASRKRRERQYKSRVDAYYELVGPPALPEETAWRHSHWQARRQKVRLALEAVGLSDIIIGKFESCGAACRAEYSPSLKRWRLGGNYCKNRHCEPCGRARATTVARNLRKRLEQKAQGRYRFITLTLRHSTKPLREQIDRLYDCFKKLRKTKAWQKTQLGGAAVLEVKLNKVGSLWHPHLHMVSEGSYLSKSELQSLWLQITGDSYVADIRGLDNATDAAYYVSKYLGKGADVRVWLDPAKAKEWIMASKGVRACYTYGQWRGFKLSEKPKDAGDWKKICTLRELLREAKAGEPWAEAVVLSLRPPGLADIPNHAADTGPPPPDLSDEPFA